VVLSALVASLVIGHSVQGRPLRAVELGDPSSARRVLVVGCIHGDECAGLAVVGLLRRSQPSFDLWLVPNLNPDGLAAHTRANAHGVDLNRNFPSQWQAAGGGGPRPFSEPETRAIRALIARLKPDLTIWLHQPQDLVRAWGPSVAAARRFARAAGLRFRALRWPNGSASNWQNHRLRSAASFVVELPPGPLPARLAGRLAAAILRPQ
jgi:protein MpaA